MDAVVRITDSRLVLVLDFYYFVLEPLIERIPLKWPMKTASRR